MKRVLIVEDDAAVRFVLRRWAEAEGMEVIEAETAEQALDLADQKPPAIAICDIGLPGNDGLWFAKQLRVRQPDTAVVLATGLVESSVAIAGIEIGVVDYVVKPFGRERMSEALRRALHVHASRRAAARATETLAEFEVNAETSVAAVLASMERSDPAAHTHARRVARLSVNLALMLNVGEPEVSEIERAALLHDIHRLPMPKELAASPVLRLPFLGGPLAMASAVHQRGAAGTSDLPLGVRIIRVADAFDNLVSGKDSPAIPSGRAVEILANDRASELDAAVVGALVTLQKDAHSAAGQRPAVHSLRLDAHLRRAS